MNPAICFEFGFSWNIIMERTIGITTESRELTTARAVPALLTDSANMKKATTNSKPRIVPNKNVPNEMSGIPEKLINSKQMRDAAR